MKSKEELYKIIFEADTKLGRLFDVVLLWLIIASVFTVLIDSVAEIHRRYLGLLVGLEWLFTVAFTLEYILRLWVSKKPLVYARSFFGIIDLLSVLPTYISLIVAGSQYLLVIRALRLLRVFRILKLVKFSSEGMRILVALRKSAYKITIFMAFVLTLVTILGAVMYLLEGARNPAFTSIPRGIYWAIVTLTTVGYGDITPQTAIGQFLAAIVMLMGYAIIAVPTGIVSSEITKSATSANTHLCRNCGLQHHEDDAKFCKRCGEDLEY